VKFPSSLDVETRLKGYKYFEIERDFFNKLDVLIDGDFKFCVLQVKFSIFFHHGSLNVIGDKFRLVRSKLKFR
jgi:hypothetical protein